MRELKDDLWAYYGSEAYAVCITTNGYVKKNGEAVMGRGVALDAAQKFPDLSKALGRSIKLNGNHLSLIGWRLYSFPVKHNWWEQADLELIRRSALELKAKAEASPKIRFILPRPGCNNGKRDWETEVRPILLEVGLPDNVIVVSK